MRFDVKSIICGIMWLNKATEMGRVLMAEAGGGDVVMDDVAVLLVRRNTNLWYV